MSRSPRDSVSSASSVDEEEDTSVEPIIGPNILRPGFQTLKVTEEYYPNAGFYLIDEFRLFGQKLYSSRFGFCSPGEIICATGLARDGIATFSLPSGLSVSFTIRVLPGRYPNQLGCFDQAVVLNVFAPHGPGSELVLAETIDLSSGQQVNDFVDLRLLPLHREETRRLEFLEYQRAQLEKSQEKEECSAGARIRSRELSQTHASSTPPALLFDEGSLIDNDGNLCYYTWRCGHPLFGPIDPCVLEQREEEAEEKRMEYERKKGPKKPRQLRKPRQPRNRNKTKKKREEEKEEEKEEVSEKQNENDEGEETDYERFFFNHPKN